MQNYIFLKNAIFEEPLHDFDMIINEALCKMISNGAEEATVQLKLDIKRTGADGLMMKHNANYNVPQKDKFDGKTIPGQYCLRVTEEGVQIGQTVEQIRMEGLPV